MYQPRFKVGDVVRSSICDDATVHKIAQVRTEENKTGRAVYRLRDVQGLHAEVNLRKINDELYGKSDDQNTEVDIIKYNRG